MTFAQVFGIVPTFLPKDLVKSEKVINFALANSKEVLRSLTRDGNNVKISEQSLPGSASSAGRAIHF